MDEMTGMELSGNVVKASKIRAERVGWLVLPRCSSTISFRAPADDRAEGCIMVPIDLIYKRSMMFAVKPSRLRF